MLVSLPVYVLATAVLFQTDARLTQGAAAGLAGVASSLEHAAAGQPGVAREAELGLLKFRAATGRLKDAAHPTGRTIDSRAGRLLAASVQQAVAAWPPTPITARDAASGSWR